MIIYFLHLNYCYLNIIFLILIFSHLFFWYLFLYQSIELYQNKLFNRIIKYFQQDETTEKNNFKIEFIHFLYNSLRRLEKVKSTKTE